MLFSALPAGKKSLLSSFSVTGCYGNRTQTSTEPEVGVYLEFSKVAVVGMAVGLSGGSYGHPTKQASEIGRVAGRLPLLPPLAYEPDWVASVITHCLEGA